MLCVYLFALSGSASRELQSLGKEAKENAKKRLLAESGETAMSPGHYQIDGLSFDLTHRIISPKTKPVLGAAFSNDRTVLALVSSKEEDLFGNSSTFIADPSSQAFLRIESKFLSDDGVSFYNLTSPSIHSLMTSIEFRTFASDTNGYDCTFDDSVYSGAICQSQFGYNWPDVPNGTDPSSLDPESRDANIFQYRIGAFSKASGSFSLKVSGFSDLRADYDIDFLSIGGIGFSLTSNFTNATVPLSELCKTIYGFDQTILGIRFALAFEGCLSFNISRISAFVPEPIDYYRKMSLSFHKSGSLSTSEGSVADPFKYNVVTFPGSNVTIKEAFQYLEEGKFNVEPEVDFGVKFVLAIGSEINSQLGIGAAYSIDWDFNANKTACTCPYLYGTSSSSLKGFIKGNGFVIRKWHLLPEFNYQFPLFERGPSQEYCLFSSENSMEGISSLTGVGADAIVVKPKSAIAANSSSEYSLRLDIFENSHATTPTTSVQLQSFNGPNASLDRVHILEGKTDDIRLRYNAVKYGTFFDDIFDFNDSFLASGSSPTNSCSGGLCVETELFSAVGVEPYKEFTSSTPLVTFKASTNSTYGLIQHGDNEKYTVAMSTTFDDTAITSDESQIGQYNSKDSVSVKFESLYFDAGSSSSAFHSILWFYRCDDNYSTCSSVGRLDLPETYRIVENNASSLGVSNWTIPFIPSKRMKVTFTTNTFLWETRKEWRIDNMNETRPFDLNLSIEDGSYKLRLRVVNHQPTVLFSAKPGKFRGIIANIFDNGIINLGVGQAYGILKFEINRRKYNRLFAIVKALGITPLCDHSWLDDEQFLINLVINETLFESSILTIEIPFRCPPRNSSFSVDASLISVFESLENPYCGNSKPFETFSDKFGCIEERSPYQPFIDQWAIIGANESSTNSTYETDFWRLNLFNLSSDQTICIQQMSWNFPLKSNKLYISKDNLGNNISEITIACDRCSRLKATTPNLGEVILKTNGKFTYHLRESTGLLFTAFCDNSSYAFCEVKYSLNGVSVLTYGTDGVEDINYNGTGIKLLHGITKQAVYGRDTVNVIKSWTGDPNITPISPSYLRFILTPNKNGTMTISTKLGTMAIPLSASKFYANPDQFFVGLGLTMPSGGFSAGDVDFTKEGQAIVNSSLFATPPLSSAYKFNSTYVDVPANYVKSTIVECAENSYLVNGQCYADAPAQKSSKLTGGEIAIITLGCILVVCIISGIVIWAIKRKKAMDQYNFRLVSGDEIAV